MTAAALRDLLISWANLNSGSDHLAGLERMRNTLRREFATLPGAVTEEISLATTRAKILRIRVRPNVPRRILFSGHYDTVYGADHPFQTCTLVNDATLRGPGVADMKGGLVVMLAALREFERSAEATQLGYDVLLTPDEETGSAASRPVLEAAARSQDFQFALIFEPARANGDLVKSRKGTGIFTLTCHGRAAHAGRDPKAGRNAILALAELLPRVDALNQELPGVLLNIGSIRGGGAVNIVPDFAAADLNLRITSSTDEVRVRERLQSLVALVNTREGYRAEISGRFNRPPKEASPFEEQLFAAWQTCARDCGVTLDWQHVAGGSDGNLFSAAGLPNLDGLGPVGDHLHSAEEFIRLPSLVERARIAARFLTGFARGELALAEKG